MKMKRKPSTQNLSWSNSRTTLLEYCQKKYFLNYYTFALKPLNIPLRKTTLTLKKLKSIEMRMGEKTHFLISDYLHQLKRGPLSAETLMQLKENIAQEIRDNIFSNNSQHVIHIDGNIIDSSQIFTLGQVDEKYQS